MDNKETNEKVYQLLSKLGVEDKNIVWRALTPETRNYISNKSLDHAYEDELKRVRFNFHGEYDTLWSLRDYRGFLSETPQHYSVLNKIATELYEIATEVDDMDHKVELQDLADALNFFIGDM